MAKQITGNYYYLSESGEVIHDSHPGRDKKTGYPKSPGKSKDARCWTEVGLEAWHYPDGTVKSGSLSGVIYSIPIVEDDDLVNIINKSPYQRVLDSQLTHYHDKPFWRYSIDMEWKESWQEEWANRVLVSDVEWWRAEVRAFLSIVKDLTEKNVELGECTQITIEYIKKYFGKKKEETT